MFQKRLFYFPMLLKNRIFLPDIEAKNSITEWKNQKGRARPVDDRPAYWPQAMMIGKTAMKQGPGSQLNAL